MRVIAVLPDLMFGSKVSELLGAAGHEVVVARAGEVAGRDAEVVLVDLASGVVAPEEIDSGPTPRLGIYAHVDAAMRERAQAAGFELVVPRSRFMREGAALVEGLVQS